MAARKVTQWPAVLLALVGFGQCTQDPAASHAEAVAAALQNALNARDVRLLEPWLADACTVPNLEPAEFRTVLANVLAGWQHTFVSHRVALQGAGKLLVTLVAADGTTFDVAVQIDVVGRLLALHLFRADVQPSDSESISFEGPDVTRLPLVAHGALWAVRARIDDREGLLAIDSGAPQLVLHHEGPRTQIGTVTGSVSSASVWSDVRTVDSLVLDGTIARCLRANAMSLAHLQGKGEHGAPIRLLGLLGKRELAAFEARFDFVQRVLELARLDADGNPRVPLPATYDEHYEFVVDGHLPVLTFQAGDVALRLAFDSGAASNLLLQSHLANASLVVRDDVPVDLLGMHRDPVAVWSAVVEGLRIGDRVVHAMRTVFVEKSPVPGLDGLVGLEWIKGRSFALNYVKRRLSLTSLRAQAPR